MQGAYNLRVIEYANGTFEVRAYDKPVNAIYTGETTVAPIYQEPKKRKYDMIYNPFTEKEERFLTVDRAEKSARDSLNRTRENIFRYARQCRWEYFLTFTFDEKKVNRYDFDDCMKKTNQWFKNQRRNHAPDLKFLYVPERHKNGAWHVHGVVCDCGNMVFTDSGRVSCGGKACVRTPANSHCSTIYNLSGWTYGFSTATRVNDEHKVATYITKYITKDLCSFTKGKKRYYRSKNIPEPKETGYIIESCDYDNFMQELEDSIGLKLVYEKKTIGDYQSVVYRYYQNNNESEVKNGSKRQDST